MERPPLTPRFFRKGALNLTLGGLLMIFCGLVHRFYLDGSGIVASLRGRRRRGAPSSRAARGRAQASSWPLRVHRRHHLRTPVGAATLSSPRRPPAEAASPPLARRATSQTETSAARSASKLPTPTGMARSSSASPRCAPTFGAQRSAASPSARGPHLEPGEVDDVVEAAEHLGNRGYDGAVESAEGAGSVGREALRNVGGDARRRR